MKTNTHISLNKDGSCSLKIEVQIDQTITWARSPRRQEVAEFILCHLKAAYLALVFQAEPSFGGEAADHEALIKSLSEVPGG